jgi:hypothetical protein
MEVENILQAVGGNAELISDGQSGVRVVRILEAAQRSIDQDGARIAMGIPVSHSA